MDSFMAERPAIEVVDVHKSFMLPHQRRTTIKEHVLHPFQRTTYERQIALDSVSFSVPHGGFFGIIGPNGSGKSTLLKILAGIYRQDRGTVRIDGILSPFIELGVGFNPELTARDNIRINGTLLGLSSSELKERYDDIVGFAELERFVDQKLKNFSSGMQVRLAYSIAIQVDFDILLLDEVLAVGDEHFQEKCFATFDRFREEGKTVVLVTHDLGSVNRFCDRVMWLDHGECRLTGAAAEVTATYRRHALGEPSAEEHPAPAPATAGPAPSLGP
jgi:ABC-type polysaccharide/polyol phosphate transport system ATPase subunit